MTPTVSGLKPGNTCALLVPEASGDDLGQDAAVVGGDQEVGVRRVRQARPAPVVSGRPAPPRRRGT